jgi:hypothetical protein
MRTFLFTAALVLSLCFSSRAQDSTLVNVKSFPEAALVLTTGAMLTGPLLLYPDAELVSVTCANDSTYTIPARLIQGFAVKDPLSPQLPILDTYLSTKRVFRVFPLITGSNQHLPSWGFYEQLSQGPGPILLLRREQVLAPSNVVIPRAPATISDPLSKPIAPPTITVYSNVVYQTTLYIRTATGTMIQLRKPQHLLKCLPRQAPLLRAYIKDNKLHYNNLRDLSFVVNYANTLP